MTKRLTPRRAALWLALLVAIAPVGVRAAPPQPGGEFIEQARERFARYQANGWTAEQTADALARYFGQEVEIREHRGVRDVVIVRRDPKSGAITYLVVAGSMPTGAAP